MLILFILFQGIETNFEIFVNSHILFYYNIQIFSIIVFLSDLQAFKYFDKCIFFSINDQWLWPSYHA